MQKRIYTTTNIDLIQLRRFVAQLLIFEIEGEIKFIDKLESGNRFVTQFYDKPQTTYVLVNKHNNKRRSPQNKVKN